MQLTFLGTGAADWEPEIFCRGGEFRRNASALVDSDLLIDPGPTVFHFAGHSGDPQLLSAVRHILVTHTHGDHFCGETVRRLCLTGNAALYGDGAVLRRLREKLGAEAERVEFHELPTEQPVQIGDYTVTSLRANHDSGDPTETPRVYLIEKNGRELFYGCDSAWLPTRTWNVLKNHPLNVLVLELTCGETAPDDWRIFEHNTPEMLDLMLAMFRKYRCFAPDVRYYVSHMARTLHTDHAALERFLAPKGVLPAYDGMTVEI